MDDERFAKFSTDPKFRTVPKKQKKLKIDPRFEHMFTDKRFDNKKIGIDKRGRPKSYSSKESYEQFYRVRSSDEDSDSEDEKNATQFSAKNLKMKVDKLEKIKISKAKLRKNTIGGKLKDNHSESEENDGNFNTNAQSEMLKNTRVDYARGKGTLMSESSSEESSDDENDREADKYEGFDKWGELDHDAETIESGEETNRLAVCNLDWDRVTATDIYVALSSFCTNSTGSGKMSLSWITRF